MGALGLLVRRSLRSNSRSALGLALVLALIGGVALTALAGARRTQSAFPRYLEASDASDLAINVISTDTEGALDETLPVAERARSIEGVVSDATYIGLESIFVTNDAGVLDAEIGGEVLGSLDGRFIDSDRVAVSSGRTPLLDALDEVFVNEPMARQNHLEVGSPMRLLVLQPGEGDPRELPVLARIDATVVGIGLFPDEVLADDFDKTPRALLTPAMTRAQLDDAGSYFWQGLHLRGGTSVDQVIADYDDLLDDGFAINVQRTDEQIDGVDRGTRPVVAALATFGTAVAMAALVLGALGALRLVASSAPDLPALRAVGLPQRTLAAAIGAPALAATALGAVGAVVLAGALSPLTPIGPVRAVEPARGMDLDLIVLGAGGLALAILVAGASVIASTFLVRREQGAARVPGPSRLVDALVNMGLGPMAAIGARHAVGPDAERRGAPALATVGACTLSVVVVISALTFGSGVRQLLRDPPRYGWAADFAIEAGGGYDFLDPEGGEAVMEGADGDLTSLMVSGNGHVQVDGRSLSTMGILPLSGPPPVTVLAGRLPTTPDEIALGRVSARDLGVGIGDRLPTDSDAVRVVGLVALPAIGPVASSHPSLGQGALLTLDGLAARDPAAYPVIAMGTYAPGVSAADAGPRVLRLVAEEMAGLPPEAAQEYVDLRPAEIAALSPASSTANLLAAMLGVAAIVALSFTLSASVRRRARTYAVLSALGVDRAGLRRSVRWQANVLIGLALALGVPIGIAVGRWTWLAFAHQLGVASTPVIPGVLIALTALAIVLVANLAGEPSTRAAARHAHRTRILQTR